MPSTRTFGLTITHTIRSRLKFWGFQHIVSHFLPFHFPEILERHIFSPAALEAYNANYVGGDITGGVMDFRQLMARPALRRSPYTTPNRRIYLCSASTPPGGGVHGMCGYHAARAALCRILRD